MTGNFGFAEIADSSFTGSGSGSVAEIVSRFCFLAAGTGAAILLGVGPAVADEICPVTFSVFGVTLIAGSFALPAEVTGSTAVFSFAGTVTNGVTAVSDPANRFGFDSVAFADSTLVLGAEGVDVEAAGGTSRFVAAGLLLAVFSIDFVGRPIGAATIATKISSGTPLYLNSDMTVGKVSK
jgi:hypothetical protein